MKTMIFRSSILLLLLGLAACGGTKVLKEPEPMVVAQPLATASDENLSVTLDWVIIRDGPGTWAKNVDWDEYLIRVQNLGDDSIQLTNITVIDSLGVSAEVGVSRKKLVKASKKTKKRYKGQGLKVKAGMSAGTLLAVGAVTAATAASVGAAAIYGSSAMAAGAVTGILLAPVLAVGGIVRGVNNSKVNNRIGSRQTLLPIMLQKEEEKTLDIFFPLSPSPRQIQLTYVDAQGEHTLIIDTQAALDGLHLPKTAD